MPSARQTGGTVDVIFARVEYTHGGAMAGLNFPRTTMSDVFECRCRLHRPALLHLPDLHPAVPRVSVGLFPDRFQIAASSVNRRLANCLITSST
jgi:hypothetical protein